MQRLEGSCIYDAAILSKGSNFLAIWYRARELQYIFLAASLGSFVDLVITKTESILSSKY